MGQKIECPKCQNRDSFRYLEDMTAERKVIGVNRRDKKLKIDGEYSTEGYDESSTNERLACALCWTEFPLPDGFEIEWI